MRFFRFSVFLGLFFSALIVKTFACSCSYMPTHSVDFRKSSAVFIGEVLETDLKIPFPEKLINTPFIQATKFKVEKSWKGAKSSEFIAWAENADLCGFKPQTGKKYLVYVRKYEGVYVFDTFCSRTRPIEIDNEETREEIKELNSFWFRFWANFAYFNFR